MLQTLVYSHIGS